MATRTEAPRSETADRGPQDARARLLALRRRPQSQPPSAAAAAPRGPVPATPAQRALWLAERVADTDGAFNTAFAVRLRGPLDRDALDGAFVGLLRRHEALRTRIVEVDGLPTLSVEPVGDARLEIVESPPGRADGPAAETALAAALREHARRPFDLARAPLARACLFALGPDDHVLLFVAHHVASDGWSRRIVARELGTLYAALAGDPRRAGDAAHAGDTTHAGRAAHAAAAALPPIATGFAAHAAREHDRDGGPGRARALQAWRERLDGLEPAGLPPDRRPSPPREGGLCRVLALHQSHINPALAQPFQTFRRNAFIDNNHINPLRINNLMQTGAVKFAGIGHDDDPLCYLAHLAIQPGFILIVCAHTTIEIDGVDTQEQQVKVVIL